MNWNKQLSVSGLALALSLGGLGAGLAGCASGASTKEPMAASKGADHQCGKAKGDDKKCGGDKGAEKSCGEKSCGGDKKAAKGAEMSCGEGSCG